MDTSRKDGYIFNFDNAFPGRTGEFDFVSVRQIGEFSIEQDREIPLHTQDCHEITYVISGKGIFFSDGEQTSLQTGDIHVISKGVAHRIVPDRRSNLRFANIGFVFNDRLPDSFRPIKAVFEGTAAICLKDKGEIRLLMTQLINEMYAKAAYSHMMAESYIKQILIHIYRLTAAQPPKAFIPKKTPAARLSPYAIIRYVDDNLYDFPDIEQIAQALGYSQSYISHIFKEKMGITLQEYICRKKIEASLDLLKYQKNTITQIAMMLNYASVQSFGKAFRKVMGCSPTEYQKTHGLEMSNEDGDPGNETV